MVEIQQTIKLPISRRGDKIVCGDRMSLQIILGTSAASGNLHLYKVQKEGSKFIVPIETVRSRIADIRRRVDKDMRNLQVMQQVLEE